MQFLKTLMWVLLAVAIVIAASSNWRDVTLDLWGNLQLTVKIPFLLALVFLLGFLPTWLVMRARVRRLQRTIADGGIGRPVPPPPPAPPVADDDEEIAA